MPDHVSYIVLIGISLVLVIEILVWIRMNRKAVHLPEEEKSDHRKIADVMFATSIPRILVMASVLTISLLMMWAYNRWEAFFATETFLNTTVCVGMLTLWILYFWYLSIAHSVQYKIASLFLTEKQMDIVMNDERKSKEKIASWKRRFKGGGE